MAVSVLQKTSLQARWRLRLRSWKRKLRAMLRRTRSWSSMPTILHPKQRPMPVHRSAPRCLTVLHILLIWRSNCKAWILTVLPDNTGRYLCRHKLMHRPSRRRRRHATMMPLLRRCKPKPT